MNYLLFFLLVTVATCQDEYGCEDDCECSDILDKLAWTDRNTILYTEEAGCVRNITCEINSFTTRAQVGPDAPTELSTNIFEFFGMICENYEWYITKYPHGVHYRTAAGDSLIGTNGELDGKKSKLYLFQW
ncbi:hypothetical protein GCK72_015826 [Caenorhabditis remanei]|uniref:DUF281 domain-containing protein n=1 Tax=Caenorhabditis remanei TaxID=31234 RepID=A0A6A5GXL0_CAERE|nr:hypothetical protein GCK72_015826 [Caenorhabditis remanei]KAF1759359.1 hypothetical protein GCK72_015826 [Caenorhabditis remanei]